MVNLLIRLCEFDRQTSSHCFFILENLNEEDLCVTDRLAVEYENVEMLSIAGPL